MGNTKLRENLIKQTQEAAVLREEGKFDESQIMFDKILDEISVLRDSKDIEDNNTYVGIMGHWIVQTRNEGRSKLIEALHVAQAVYDYSKDKGLNNANAVSGVSNTLLNLEGYELAEKYLKEKMKYAKSDDPYKYAESIMHYARCLFRTGRVEEAEESLQKAVKITQEKESVLSDIEKAPILSGLFFMKALIMNQKNKLPQAIENAEEALKIAKENDITIRMSQIGGFLDYLRSKDAK